MLSYMIITEKYKIIFTNICSHDTIIIAVTNFPKRCLSQERMLSLWQALFYPVVVRRRKVCYIRFCSACSV